MIPLLFCLLSMVPAAQDKAPEKGAAKSTEQAAADPKRVQAAVAELDAAFKEKKSADKIQAIQNCTDVLDPAVIERIAKGLKDKDIAVKQAAIEALGHMPNPASVKALNGLYQAEKKTLSSDDITFPMLLKLIGRLGDPSSVAVLSDSPFSSKIYPTIQARLYGLGNIRTVESVDALIGFMKLGAERTFQSMMGDWQVALVHLIGTNHGGESIQLWQKWWRENKKDFKMPPEAPAMPPDLQMKWDSYWGISPNKAPESKREPEKK